MVEKGVSCNLYKICRICHQTKWYKSLMSKGKAGRRKTVCYECYHHRKITQHLRRKKKGITLNRGKRIQVLVTTDQGKTICYPVPYSLAKKIVDEEMAYIIHPRMIKMRYDSKTFKN